MNLACAGIEDASRIDYLYLKNEYLVGYLMSTRASLVYIAIGLLLVGYVSLHWLVAQPVEVTVERKWSTPTTGRWGRSGTAYFVDTDTGVYGFFGTPFTSDNNEMFARLRKGENARIRAIRWLHGPLLAALTDRAARPSIVEVLD